MATLLDNASSTGPADYWEGGRGQFRCEGTFDGASVILQMRGPNNGWVDIQGASLSAAGFINVEMPPGFVRANVSGGTAPSGLYADLVAF